MDDDVTEAKQFASFERYDEFVSAQNALLAMDLASEPSHDDNGKEIELLRKLILIVGVHALVYRVLIFNTPSSWVNIKNRHICSIHSWRAWSSQPQSVSERMPERVSLIPL